MWEICGNIIFCQKDWLGETGGWVSLLPSVGWVTLATSLTTLNLLWTTLNGKQLDMNGESNKDTTLPTMWGHRAKCFRIPCIWFPWQSRTGATFYPPRVTGKESELGRVESFAKSVNSRLRNWAWACCYVTNLWIIVDLWQRALTWMGFFRKD